MTRIDDDMYYILALSGLHPLAKERTLQALYHVLRGRKANQTFQDVHMFYLHPYYRLFPSLPKDQWKEILLAMIKEKWIEPYQIDRQKHSFRITEKGEMVLLNGEERFQFSVWFTPFRANPGVVWGIAPFWLRLHLMVQTISHLIEQNVSFYPLVQEKQVQMVIKRLLATKEAKQAWMEGLHQELYALLVQLPDEVQPLIVYQLAGARQTAITEQQLAFQLDESSAMIRLKWRYGLALMRQRLLLEGTSRFPLLHQLIADDLSFGGRLSSSAQETYKLLQRKRDLDEIAQIRRLTRNTIEDHLVEIALRCPEWDNSPYLDEASRKEILSVSQALQTRRLRLIKDRLGEKYTFLQIRLALAGREKEGSQV